MKHEIGNRSLHFRAELIIMQIVMCVEHEIRPNYAEHEIGNHCSHFRAEHEIETTVLIFVLN